MIKFIIKCIVVLLALQSAMDYLRKEAIIEGSIEINYSVIQQKLASAVPMKKIVGGLFELVADKIQDRVENDFQPAFQRSEDQFKERVPPFKIIEHMVERGDTLDQLAQRYGVHWRVIQRVNYLDDGHKLLVGQRLRIPSKMHQLI